MDNGNVEGSGPGIRPDFLSMISLFNKMVVAIYSSNICT